MPIASVNPATGQTLQKFDELRPAEVEAKLQLALTAFREHRRSSFAERAKNMLRAAEILDSEAERWARLMVLEMGKTKQSAVAEAKKCAWVCRYYADHAEKYLADEPLESEQGRNYIRHLPIGPVLAIMPWNFPFWQVFRFAAPALMAGNVGLLKHASNVPQCALAIEEILRRAGFSMGVFQTLLLGSARVAPVISDARIAAVTLTGSDTAGAEVAGLAGKNLKKSVLELGGSDAFIVLPSADFEAAVKTAVTARNINNGQSCIAAKRFIIHRALYDRFVPRFVASIEKLKVGDPMEDSTDIGPLALRSVLEGVEAQVADALERGARLLTGGKRIAGAGYFYRPGVLAEIPRTARVYREEVFGPVALVFKVNDLEEAIALANDSPFGLGSSVWTSDAQEQQQLIDRLEAGMTFVNAMVASDPRMPFGGVKRSGYGRELSRDGIREFVNIKAVRIQESKPRAENQVE
jgi:succinate-semialdehyde dehydrogenase/glutarate-semialdehyde dehydrogenase